jgi:hypothetical protein
MVAQVETYARQVLVGLDLLARQNQVSIQLDLIKYWKDELAKPRYDEPGNLSRHGNKVYSQFDEDGIIEEIFRRIGTEHRTFIEFGVETGIECNSLKLLVEGWRGLWIDGGKDYVAQIRTTHKAWLDSGALKLVNEFVLVDNIEKIIGESNIGEVDLLSIDIDFNDFWIWRAITSIRPRVVVIEYNATWKPPLSMTVPYTPHPAGVASNYFGASLEAFTLLGKAKGYRLVGCGFSGVNAFFVRDDLCGTHFVADATAANFYEPPRYFMIHLSGGHPPSIGPLVEVN